MTNLHDLINRFAAQENELRACEFLAPAIGAGTIEVRIGEVVCQMNVHPSDFVGWGVFRTDNLTQAKLVRKASLTERRDYLSLFPHIGMIACINDDGQWRGCAASFGDRRWRVEGAPRIELPEELQLFDTLRTRFDGHRFWFESVGMRGDPTIPGYLRGALAELVSPSDVARRGLSAEQRAAYELNYIRLATPPSPDVTPTKSVCSDATTRLGDTLSHAGAELVDYLERADSFRVSFKMEGRKYTSAVNKSDLTVQVAGVCLSGEDEKFDLGSLVGVIRQGERYGEVVRIGRGEHDMAEEVYWRVHPPRD